MKENKGRIRIVIVAAFVILISLFAAKKAEAVDIMISNEDLDTARTAGTYAEKGITYTKFTEQQIEDGFDGVGIFSFSIAETYKLEENITLDGECFVFTAENADVIFDLNGKTINYVNEVSTEYPDEHGEGQYDPYSAIRGTNNCLFITGNGTINTPQTAGEYYGGAIEFQSEGIIYNGTYNGSILCGYQLNCAEESKLLTVHGGTFNRLVASSAPVYINDGKFDELYLDKGGVINGGSYEEIEADSYYYYLEKYGEIGNVTEVLDLVINGGTFKYTGDSGIAKPIETRGVNLFINDGTYTNIGEHEIYSDCVSFDGIGIASLRVNGGNFDAPVGYCLYAEDATKITINDGTFKGYYAGVILSGNSNLDVQLTGGTYVTTGIDKRGFSRNIFGGIVFQEVNEYIGEDNVLFVKNALAPGYKYSPSVNVASENANDSHKILSTQRAIKVIPADEEDFNIVSNSEELKTQATTLVKKIVAGESVEGIKNDLAEAILYAVGANRELRIELIVNKVNKEDVVKDAEAIEEAVEAKQSISGFFDVSIVVMVDGTACGKITKLDEAITVDIPIDESERNAAEGFTRAFKVYKVHNGNVDALDTKTSGEYASASSSEFSTYALAYEDVEGVDSLKSPKAGDNGIVAWISVIAVSAALGIAVIKTKKE